MKQKIKKIKLTNIPVYEHLEFDLKKTTYADRLLWLEQANEFVRSIKRPWPIPASLQAKT